MFKKLMNLISRIESPKPSSTSEPKVVPLAAEPQSDPEQDEEMVPRSAQEAAQRLLALLAAVGHAHQPDDVRKWRKANGIDEYLSPMEAHFVSDSSPSRKDIVAFSWRAEAAVSIVWALGGVREMPALNAQFNLYEVGLVRDALSSPNQFISEARLLPAGEIEELEGDIYHQHWRVRDAELFGKEMPQELDPGIVYERRYALSWLVGWGEGWDDVPTDT